MELIAHFSIPNILIQMVRVRLQRLTFIAISVLVVLAFFYFNSTKTSHDETLLWEKIKKELDVVNEDSANAKVDWVDHEFLKNEELRKGPGENGRGVSLSDIEKLKLPELMNVNGFNAIASDKISVHRSMKDLRLDVCETLKYSANLPQATIIIPFHEEHWSTLLRTVHSLLSRAPEKLVLEVILVDDDSKKKFLGSQLEDYIDTTFDNVRIIRTEKREGLIRARLLGAKAAKAPVLIFIDSHCEAGTNWLPPLLEPILDNYRTVTCPFIDVINENDFSIHPQDEGARGAFDWNFDYKRLSRLKEDAKHPEKPFVSPVMAGGLFAISSKWFWELGGYDSGLEVWGGEQYELSFKIWMCGGVMVDIPCSRIAHVYRRFNPFGVHGAGDYLRRNYKRIAEVWMDDWKRHLYEKRPSSYIDIDPGNLTEQKALRSSLNCKSFDWFMKVVAFDLVKSYPPIEPVPMSNGRFISDAQPTMCIDSKFGNQGDRIRLEKCVSGANPNGNGEQNFEFTWKLEIRPRGRSVCFDYPGVGVALLLYQCHSMQGNQYWKYNLDTHQILHFNSKKCIDSKPQRSEIFLDLCQESVTQRWTLEGLNKTAARERWNQSD